MAMHTRHNNEEVKEQMTDTISRGKEFIMEHGGNPILNFALLIGGLINVVQGGLLYWKPHQLAESFLDSVKLKATPWAISRCLALSTWGLAGIQLSAIWNYDGVHKRFLNWALAGWHVLSFLDAWNNQWWKESGFVVSPLWFHGPMALLHLLAASWHTAAGPSPSKAKAGKRT